MQNFLTLLASFFAKRPGLGAEINPPDSRDIQLASFLAPVSLPADYETDISTLPVMDQKSYGTCVGQAEGNVVAFFDYLENKNSDVSKRYIYAKSKLVDGLAGQGTFPRVASAIIANTGATTGKFVPDDNTLPYPQYLAIPSDSAALIADAKNRRANYAFVGIDITAIKQAIYANKLVTISIMVDWSAFKSTGKIKAPNPNAFAGNHRIILYGWTGTKLKFRNSWGESWGIGGNGIFDFLDYSGYIFDALCYTDIPNEILQKAQDAQYIFTKEMKLGMVDFQVGKLQERFGLAMDNKFGPITKAAVIKFQLSRGIKGDGAVGPLTIFELNKKKIKMILLDALISIESQGNDNAIGDKTLKNHAYGCLQIRQGVCDDVNRKFGTKFKASDCLGNRQVSFDIWNKYWLTYPKIVTDEDRARTWNGGPGWRRNPKLTDGYWAKVVKLLA